MRRLMMLLAATIAVLAVPLAASAAVPADPRITAAVRAWATEPLYVDPDFAAIADEEPMLAAIRAAKVPTFVAVVPTGDWFQEKGDADLLAGWLATANNKPGLYIVMDGSTMDAVEHQLAASAVGNTWARDSNQPLSDQLSNYLAKVRVGDDYPAEPARTTPYQPAAPRPAAAPERVGVGKAIGVGVAGGLVGLIGGGLLAGVVLAVAAIVSSGRGGKS
ncbi:hypothetical protein ABZS29_08885 [Kribbella sp. NPDC005582]|uniref:hypothetical protein n=1 Tax=Kribbella sp. NPDC005582 TaxID=3156893 RepID=UPI0033A14DDC